MFIVPLLFVDIFLADLRLQISLGHKTASKPSTTCLVTSAGFVLVDLFDMFKSLSHAQRDFPDH